MACGRVGRQHISGACGAWDDDLHPVEAAHPAYGASPSAMRSPLPLPARAVTVPGCARGRDPPM